MVQAFQVNALVRKSLAYQKKNVSTNLCVLITPIIIIGLLAAIQRLIDNENKLFAEDKCGCECIRCIVTDKQTSEELYTSDDPSICNFNEDDSLYAYCLARNATTCGIEYSDPWQIENCAIPQPPRWPPLFDLKNGVKFDSRGSFGDAQARGQAPGPPAEASVSNSDDYNPEDYNSIDQAFADYATLNSGELSLSASETSFVYTGETAFSTEAMQRFIRNPNATMLANDASIAMDIQTLSNASAQVLTSAPAIRNLLKNSEWDFGVEGTNRENVYVDDLYSGGFTYSVLRNCSALQDVYDSFRNTVVQDDNRTEFEGFEGVLRRLFQFCASSNLTRVEGAVDLDRELYCTHDDNTEVLCRGRRAHYFGGFNWKDSDPGTLNLDTYMSDPGWELTRPYKAITRAVEVFMEEWLGEGVRSRMVGFSGMPKPETLHPLDIDISAFVGSLFFLWLIQLPLPWAVVQLVYEKQHHLRSMMRMHGLSNGSYVLVMYLYFVIQYYLYVIVMAVAAVATGLGFFTRNGVGAQILFYGLFGNMQVAFAFLLSCFFSGTRSANITCWIWILGSALFGQFLLENVFANERWWAVLVQLVPTFGAYRGLWELGQFSIRAIERGSGAKGLTLSDLGGEATSMRDVLLIFFFEWVVFMALAWYLEQVLSTATGIRRHWLFPFQFEKKSAHDRMSLNDAPKSEDTDLGNLAEDVLRERERAHTLEPSEDNPIVLTNLRKEFSNPKKVAVQNLSLSIAKGECFGLLGPNGAGKSTSINMMIGFLEATAGTAFINGMNIKRDMNEIYKVMGVCPQDNLLWETLTAREHLNFYGRLKQLSGSALKEAVDDALTSVNLFEVGNKRSGKFSGGMKRRLSCAISLIGNPVVTYMDEPSTGLDPSARRQLWGTIADAKQGKAMVLTTHSMEEAERLCDRLGIFIDGQLACVGAPKALAARYGGYNVFTITTPEHQLSAARAFTLKMCPTGKCTYSVAGTSTWHLPTKDIQLSAVFEAMRGAAGEGLEVLDWGVHSASLQDVFIQLAQDALRNQGKSKDSAVVNMNESSTQ